MERFFIDRIKLNKENIDNTKYPFNIKCLRDFDELKIDVINKFDKLNFMQYPILEIQGYNDFVIRFTKFEEIYYNMINAFNDNDIINIFTKVLNKFFNDFE